MNSCNFVGRLCADPELRRTNDGTAVCSYSIAVKRPGVKDTTDFIDIVTWRQGAEYLAKYGSKGDIVAVTGSLQPRSWTDKDGNKRRVFEVVTTSVELLSSRRNYQEASNTYQGRKNYPGASSEPAQHQKRSGDYEEINDPDVQLPF